MSVRDVESASCGDFHPSGSSGIRIDKLKNDGMGADQWENVSIALSGQ